MKKLSLILLIIMPFTLSAQWNTIAYNNGTAFIAKNSDTLIAVANGSHINIGYNGGNNWTYYETEMFGDCWADDIQFPTPNVGYVCGGSAFGLHKQFILKTTDGGTTWDSLAADIWGGFGIRSLWFVNADTGFIAANESGLWKTTDGGVTYTNVSISGLGGVTDIFFTNNETGFLSTYQQLGDAVSIYRIIKTMNNGNDWAVLYADTMGSVSGLNHRTINEIKFVDDLNGFAVGGNGLFLKTTDGGDSWSSNFIHPYSNLTSVDFTNTTTGYINNAGSIFKTTDGGASWTIQGVNPISIITKIDMVNDTLGFAFSGNAVYKTINAGGNTTSIDNAKLKEKIKIYPNPASEKIYLECNNGLHIESIQLTDIAGKLVKSFNPTDKILNVSGLANGTYLLDIKMREGNVSEKIVVHD